jgi:hypothetical protein
MSAAMNPLDVALVAAIVGSAIAFLIFRLIKPAPPACHTLAAMNTQKKAPDVVLGASLERGLRRAREKSRAT